MEDAKQTLNDQAIRFVSTMDAVQTCEEEIGEVLLDKRGIKGNESVSKRAARAVRRAKFEALKEFAEDIKKSAREAFSKLAESVYRLDILSEYEDDEIEQAGEDIAEACLTLSTATRDVEKLRELID